MGKYDKARAKTGLRIPPGDARTTEVDEILDLTYDDDSKVRALAVKNLCPCHVRADVEPVWSRIYELATDPERMVRAGVLHALGDGSPRDRVDEVVGVLEVLRRDPDRAIRRTANKVLWHHQRTGKVNIL